MSVQVATFDSVAMPCSICGKGGHNASSCWKHELPSEATKKDEVPSTPEQTNKAEVPTPEKSSSVVGTNGSENAPPAKKPRTEEANADPSSDILGPVLVPNDDDFEANVTRVMAGVCRAVCANLPSMLHELGIVPSANVPLHEHKPLDINAATISNYKEPWRKSRAVESVHLHQMYEASGNPFWFRHSTTDVGDEFPRETVPWHTLAEYRDVLFACPQECTRMLFPTTLLGHMVDPNAMDVDFFPGNIVLVCGTPILWAMYNKFCI